MRGMSLILSAVEMAAFSTLRLKGSRIQNTLLYTRKATLASLEMELLETLNEVEEFIKSVDDSRMRRIITLRFNDNLSWFKVAERLGGKSTADSVRMEFNRFMEKK